MAHRKLTKELYFPLSYDRLRAVIATLKEKEIWRSEIKKYGRHKKYNSKDTPWILEQRAVWNQVGSSLNF